MVKLPSIDPKTFVAAVQPLLESRDLNGLLDLLRERWRPEQIVALLGCPCRDAQNVAALSLSLIGGKHCVDAVAARLKDEDPIVNQVAEHALWNIWFRASTPDANRELCRGTKALHRRDFDVAREHFNQAIAIDPDFAEAYNQRALASYLQDQFEDSISDCQEAIRRMPCHFLALAGMGHAHAHLGRLSEALECYQRALAVNPHMDCVREAVEELQQRLGGDEG